jgi:hypothetical protein
MLEQARATEKALSAKLDATAKWMMSVSGKPEFESRQNVYFPIRRDWREARKKLIALESDFAACHRAPTKIEYIAKLEADLSGLLAGTVRPSTIIGAGSSHPKSVASAWLRKEIHNIENPSSTVQYIGVSVSGIAHTSKVRAMKSKAYQALLDGTFEAINNQVVTGYGVMSSQHGDGFEVYVCLTRINESV